MQLGLQRHQPNKPNNSIEKQRVRTDSSTTKIQMTYDTLCHTKTNKKYHFSLISISKDQRI